METLARRGLGHTVRVPAAPDDPVAAPYLPARAWDEAVLPDGTTRPPSQAVMAKLAGDPAGLAARVRAGLERDDVRFGGAAGDLFSIDPVPRVIAAEEWGALS